MSKDHPEPCELADLVYEKPLSGAFEEMLFGSDSGNTLWVKFSDKNGINEWIGKFGVGGQGAGRITKVAEPDQFLISAGGFAYLVDATKRRLTNQYCERDARDIIYDSQRKLLIVADYTQLNWVEFENKTLFSRKIAVDGIRDLKIENHVLSGLAIQDYGGEEKRFKFDLEKLEVLSWEKSPKLARTIKPWWKFW